MCTNGPDSLEERALEGRMEGRRGGRGVFGRAARTAAGLLGVGALALLGACETAEQVVDRYRDLTPHEAYLESLRDAGLAGTALGQEWVEAATRAVEEPVRVELPHREEGWISPDAPSAVGYRVSLRRGQVLSVRVGLETPERTELFLDLFRVPADGEDPLRPVQSADSLADGIQYEPWRSGDYVVRVQPELLRGGRYRVLLSLDPSLDFPVADRDVGAIQSFFGAERDAGRRSHHGVDIFAPRGTPVVAATDGVVSRANVTNLGGKVVWLRDARHPQSLYYAHLDSQAVARGDRVVRGDTLGFVGNSGNARTTPPHLHFGIYRRGDGPIDPIDHLRRVRRALPEWPDEPERLGSWVRVREDGARLRAGPDLRGPLLEELARHTPLRVTGGAGDWWRVELPDGRAGYLATFLTEPLDGPVGERIVDRDESVRASPASSAPVVEPLAAGSEVPVLGRFGAYELVEPRRGLRGWLPVRSGQEP